MARNEAPRRDAPRHDAEQVGGVATKPGTPAPPPDWQLWLSFLGAPTLWLVHFLLYYLAVELACSLGSSGTFVHWALGGGTLLFAVGALAFTCSAFIIGRRAVRSREVYDDFLPRVGAILGAMATFSLLLEALPIMFVNVCR